MKYYFITYQAETRELFPKICVYNKVIDVSPMEYINDKASTERAREEPYYRNFVVINTLEITEEEYNQFKDKF